MAETTGWYNHFPRHMCMHVLKLLSPPLHHSNPCIVSSSYRHYTTSYRRPRINKQIIGTELSMNCRHDLILQLDSTVSNSSQQPQNSN